MKKALPNLTEAVLALVDMGNELGIALSDQKIQFSEWFKIGAPLLRLPGILAKKEELIKELKQWVENDLMRIELMREVQERLEIPHERARQIVIETIDLYIYIERYIGMLKEAPKESMPSGAIDQRIEMIAIRLHKIK